MRYQNVVLDAMAYVLPPNVVTSESLEERIAPVYEKLHLRTGQLSALTGIRERRWWDPDTRPSVGATRAAERVLEKSSVLRDEIGAVVYAGVCRDNFEPATACAVAADLGFSADTEVVDISNACLGVMNAIISVANQIELGQIKAGLVVSCETAREINDVMIDEMNADPSMEMFKQSVATLTGGSGAVALVLRRRDEGPAIAKLRGGVRRSAPQHHALCRWGDDLRLNGSATQYFETDAVEVLKYGVQLGLDTWTAFLAEMNWQVADVDKVICHQVGRNNRTEILSTIGIDESKDFSTFEHLGNIGTVSLPLTAAIAHERGFLKSGDRTGFLGIGSGLNCLMLGWEWGD